MRGLREQKQYPDWQWKVAKIAWLIGLPIIGLLIYFGQSSSPSPAAPARGSVEYETCDGDVDCAQRRSMSSAVVDCATLIERTARYQARWTNGALEPIFQNAKWSERYDDVRV